MFTHLSTVENQFVHEGKGPLSSSPKEYNLQNPPLQIQN